MSKALASRQFLVAAILLVTVAIVGFSVVGVAQAIGTNKVENYVPVVKYNEGIYTELPIQTTVGITAASMTLSGAATVGGNLAVTGNASVTGTLGVTGTTTLANSIMGAGITASSTSANAGTIQAANWDTEETFSITNTVGAMTVTTPSSSTPPFSNLSAGQKTYRCVENATTTPGIAVTVAAGTGVNANVASSSTLVLGATARLCGWAHKATDTDIEWDVTKFGE